MSYGKKIEKQDKLQNINKRFEKKGQYGDLTEAARKVGFTATTTSNSLKREKYADFILTFSTFSQRDNTWVKLFLSIFICPVKYVF